MSPVAPACGRANGRQREGAERLSDGNVPQVERVVRVHIYRRARDAGARLSVRACDV